MTEVNTHFDVLIAGGGPAGMSALLWCGELGLGAVLLEKEAELGGQLLHTYNAVRNHLGAEADNGLELRDVFLQQIAGLNIVTRAEIVGVDLANRSVSLADGRKYSGRAMFLATGVRRRKLMVPGEEKFHGRGLLGSGMKAREDMRGRSVLIVGGGDAALENALILSETAANVFVVHRRSKFTARKEFIEKAERAQNVEFIFNSKVTAIIGTKGVESVEIEHLTSGERTQLEPDAILIRIGIEPNSELFRDQIELDDAGYVRINGKCETSRIGVFAGGDVTNPNAPTISAAVGQGSAAVKAILAQLRRW